MTLGITYVDNHVSKDKSPSYLGEERQRESERERERWGRGNKVKRERGGGASV